MKHMLHGIDYNSGELPPQDHYTDLDVSVTTQQVNPNLLGVLENVVLLLCSADLELLIRRWSLRQTIFAQYPK